MRDNTLVDRVRCFSLFNLAKQINDVEGNILEVGSWRGGSAGILAKTAPFKKIYLADTFQGVVKSSSWEHYSDGAHSDVDVDEVKSQQN